MGMRLHFIVNTVYLDVWTDESYLGDLSDDQKTE